jgi:hypothetical protein
MSHIKDTDIGGPVVRQKLPKATSSAALSRIPNAASRLDPERTDKRSEDAFYKHLEHQRTAALTH